MRKAQRFDGFIAVVAGAKIAERESCLRGVGRKDSGEIQIEPVLAMHRARGPGKEVGRVAHHPVQMRPHLADVDAASGMPVDDLGRAALSQGPGLVGRACIEP